MMSRIIDWPQFLWPRFYIDIMQRKLLASVFGPSYYIDSSRKFSPPMEGFFLAPAEGQGLSGPKVTLPDEQTDGRTDGRTMGLKELDAEATTGNDGINY